MEMNKAITSSVELRGHIGQSQQLIFPFIKTTERKSRHNNKTEARREPRLPRVDRRAQICDVCATERGQSRSV